MKKQWLMVLVGFILIMIIPACGYIRTEISIPESPSPKEGVLDLSNWNFAAEGLIRLSGEWEFYRGQLLIPEDFAESSLDRGEKPELSGMVQLPGQWNGYIAGEGQSSGSGYGTFRLRIQLKDDAEEVFGIRTTNIRMANKIFINGHEAGASGNPAKSAAEGEQNNTPYVGFAAVSGNEIEIIVQVANYSYASGGIIYPILFGDLESIMKSREFALFGDYMTLAGLLIFFLFFLVLFQKRKQERSLLYLCLFCLISLLYVLTHGEKLIGGMIPGLGYGFVLKVQMVSSVLAYFFLLHYANVSVPNAISRKFIRICNWLALLLSLAAIIVPVVTFSRYFPLLVVIGAFVISGMVYIMIIGILRRTEDAVYMLFSIMSILAIIVINILHVLGKMENQFFVPYEMLIFVAVQILLLSGRFARSFYEVEELSRKLLTLDELKDEFMANTSHELRTPLHGIVNIAESLLEGVAGAPNQDQAKQLSMIVSTGRRLSYLINDILDFAKLKNKDMILNRQAVDLPSVAQSVLEVIEHLSGMKGIVLTQQWPDNLPLIDTDEDRLRQVLYNLLGNAVKFTHRGEIRVFAEVGEGSVTIFVSDTGIGIAKERFEDIFKSFDTGSGLAELSSYSGTGLGLSITKKLVELNEGQIKVESELGKGSVFQVTLPAAKSAVQLDSAQNRRAAAVTIKETAVAVESVKSAPSPAAANDFTVMVVDDDPVNLQVLINLLSMEGYTVIAVNSGADALQELAGNFRIDLVITDWMMPAMSGIELCREIRQRRPLSELPLLMLTARSQMEDIQTGFSVGVNDFLSKPVEAGVLRARVRTLLELRKSVQSAIRSEMAFLQAQIKPHFLYNALNTMIAICPTDPEKATELLMELSRYLRSSFDFHNRAQFVSLDKELELVRSYMALEQARFGERLKISYEISTHLQGLIPPLSIQPIVENAVRHGVMQKSAGGTIRLMIKKEGNALKISVTDDGIGMKIEYVNGLLSEDSNTRGVGLVNIHRRLLTLYGKGVQISSEWKQGTTVSFEVPQAQIGGMAQKWRGAVSLQEAVERRG
ncbi:hybrid sensor histidine kinase/response regulator [Paenibacillus eucommiae]|uniref:histidine kinase n=1 Tax=Paenibacillus eucommiae TaxID=1355755 RepID=A0ABS4J6L6_9BACL|nr:ATP-binding protein [Paenibacillus eucommiae]MBP1994906.1 signal transduction histidine kinase [Paenibacillus eucommiae]